jgi:hypothetical protein
MPEKLKEIHQQIDTYVEKIYNIKEFESDDKKIAVLFELYEIFLKKEMLV